MNFKEIYKLPFTIPKEFGDIYAFDSNGIKVFTAFDEKSKMHMKNIVNILNGKSYACKYVKEEIDVERAKLVIRGCPILVRAWGYLTGIGGLNLDPKEAANIQDDFIKWVIEQITE